jgi:hypothetical protein
MDSINSITAANLRLAADLLDEHPDLPQPYITTISDGTLSLHWFLHLSHVGTGNEKADAAAIVKAIDGRWDRRSDDWNDKVEWRQSREGMSLLVQVSREAVCERIVTGTETVTVPAVEAQPERTEEREVVEWRCEPLLKETADEPVREQVSA